MGTNVQPLKAPESALGESEDRFRLLVEGTRDYAIFMLDPDGHVASWNAGAERIKGYRADEIIGRHFSTFYTEPDLESRKPWRELEIAKAEGKYEEEGWRLRKDGTTFWASVLITSVYNRDGELTGFGKVTRDLTERRAAEEVLRRSEAQYRMLVSSVKDYAIFMLDPEGRVQTWNAGAERIKGYRADEIIGRHFSTFYPPEDIAAGKPVVEIRTAIAEGKYEEEGWRLRKDGSRFWAGVVLTAVRDEAGTLMGFAKITRDLTERRRLELDLRDKNSALEAALRAKDRFLASMSHELRTPLNAIIGYTGTLLMRLPGPLNDDQEKQLRSVQAGGRHLLSLINDLLDLAKINSGKVVMHPERVSCRQALEEVATTLRPIAQEREVSLEVEAVPEDASIWIDRRALSQILLNLANNACKFTERGAVRLGCAAAPGGRVEFRVSDTGVGIRAEDLSRLFQPFVRLGDPGEDGPSGTGLGLHLSQKLAELVGGRIAVDSEYGRGSRFTLSVPGA